MARKSKSLFSKLETTQKVTVSLLLLMLFAMPIALGGVMTGVLQFSSASGGIYPTPKPDTHTANLVLNPSFEVLDAQGFPMSWTAGTGLTNADRVTDRNSATGTNSFSFVGNNNRKELVQKVSVALPAGTRIDLSANFQYRNSNPNGLIAVEYDFENSSGVYDTYQMKANNDSAVSWLGRGESYILSSPTSAITVRLVVEGQRGPVLFDSITMKATTPTPSPYPTSRPIPTTTPLFSPSPTVTSAPTPTPVASSIPNSN